MAVPEADRAKKWRRVGRPAAVNGGGLIEQRDMGLWVVVKAAAAVTIAEFVYGGNDDDEVGRGRRMFILGPLERERERERVFV